MCYSMDISICKQLLYPKRTFSKSFQNLHLSVAELSRAERYWISISQSICYPVELSALHSNHVFPSNSVLKSLNPFLDTQRNGLIRVGGRISNSKLSYNRMHPIVLHGKYPITKLLIHSEHLCLLHAGPSLLCSSISLRFHIISLRKVVRSITRDCVVCKRHKGKPSFQLQGQLPQERISPGSVFKRVDYARPINIKYGFVRRPTIVKAYVCLFVSLTVKAVHLELVSDLTTKAFIAALRRFTAWRGYPTLARAGRYWQLKYLQKPRIIISLIISNNQVKS